MKLDSVFKFKPYFISIVLLEFFMVIVKSSPVLFERDILIEQDAKPMGNRLRTKRAAVRNTWDFGVIPYVIDANVGFSEEQKARFKEAMQHWEKFTCIKFVERNADEHDYFIRFTEEDCGCCAGVGKQSYYRYSGQDVSIGDGCHYKGTILHELGHVIGFWHEHQRPDREDYIQIQRENILDGQEHNFEKYTTDDVDSIMHYSRYAFSKYPFETTMLSKMVGKNEQIPRLHISERELSPSDIRQTNKLYKCPECGRTFHDRSATFTSPNYHTNSGKEFQCEWRISVAQGKRIQLNITDLDIFESIDCQSNYLEIRDGYWHKAPLLGRFCGVKTNIPMILSTGNRMVINYVTNKPEHKGFSANYISYTGHTSICSNLHSITKLS